MKLYLSFFFKSFKKMSETELNILDSMKYRKKIFIPAIIIYLIGVIVSACVSHKGILIISFSCLAGFFYLYSYFRFLLLESAIFDMQTKKMFEDINDEYFRKKYAE
jgi:hypothetical protein